MIICGIYKITNPVGKVYIGQSENIYNRWKDYYKLSCNKQVKLYRSLKKYKPCNHTFEIIEECEFINLNCRERYWQDFYNVLNRKKGLNLLLTPCENKYSVPDNIRNKIKKSLIKYNKEKNSPIYQYDLNGELVNTWKNLSEFDNHPIFNKLYIGMCCNNKHKKAYGYLWSYIEKTFDKSFLDKVKLTKSDKLKGHKFNLGRKLTEEHKKKIGISTRGYKHKKEDKLKIAQSKYKPVIQYDKNMNKIKEWNSATEAAIQLNMYPQNISSCCNGKLDTTGGYKWKFEKQLQYTNKLNN